MTYKLRYTSLSENDLLRVKEEVFEASKSIDVTERYLDDFLTKIEKKKDFPFSGTPLYYGDYFTGFYFVHFKAYNAFYRINDDCMEVLRVLSSKSDYIRILLGEYYIDDIETYSQDLNEGKE